MILVESTVQHLAASRNIDLWSPAQRIYILISIKYDKHVSNFKCLNDLSHINDFQGLSFKNKFEYKC